ncbi:MAG TPA: GNAT family N-acetyltransferase [Kofleriaceae bacterium]|nr:GNAT family N-acetyltransferase [Kofleriaceae bacterium]
MEDEIDLLDVQPLVDNELELHLVERTLAERERNRVPAYRFDLRVAGEKAGTASLRVGTTQYLELYAGHIGYGVDLPFRGKRYAARTCLLLFGLARQHGMTTLWITCNPENVASRRTCELVGGVLVDIVDLPPETDMYKEGERQKCRYRVRL